MTWHKLLERQVKKHLPEALRDDNAIQQFLNVISESYTAYDRDNALADHAFRLSEADYLDLNKRLQSELDMKQLSVTKLVESIRTIDENHTELKQLDHNNLLEIATYLEEQIAKRKKAELEMVEAMEAAERANMAKSDFLSIMSHEIRTPLNAVIGMAHLLKNSDPKPEQLQNLTVLNTASHNLLMLINDILDFSKIESGKLELEHTPFDFRQMCKDLRDSNLVRAQEKGVRLKLRMDEDLPDTLIGDSLRIGQVVNNLLSNAIKFTKEGSVQLDVEVLEDFGNIVKLRLSVKDTGIGIPADKLESIFESFTQAGSGTTRQFGGTGLGLCISKKLLELMDTDLCVKSTFGAGSEFWFDIALMKSDQILQQPVANETAHFDLKGTEILLVEDTPFNIIFATQLLEGWNARVKVAENGLIALEKLKESSFSLILMDLLMPEMDGFKTALEIRNRGIQTPIIALTASATSNVRNRIETVGMQDYVTKPFNPKDLYSKMCKLLPKSAYN